MTMTINIVKTETHQGKTTAYTATGRRYYFRTDNTRKVYGGAKMSVSTARLVQLIHDGAKIAG